MRRCFFFDRDGIVNESPGPGRYVETWEGFHLQTGFVDVLRRVTGLGFSAVIITNQRCVALGLISIAGLEDIHQKFRSLLQERYNLRVTDIVYCPHDRGQCSCRKPQPGMILDAARRHDIDLSGSWMVGDSETDVEAGRSAGCRTIRVAGEACGSRATLTVPSLEVLDSLIAEGRLVV
jgi:D-glycero-D-manno-heptose 1,7-bisphosphate phosphatase